MAHGLPPGAANLMGMFPNMPFPMPPNAMSQLFSQFASPHMNGGENGGASSMGGSEAKKAKLEEPDDGELEIDVTNDDHPNTAAANKVTTQLYTSRNLSDRNYRMAVTARTASLLLALLLQASRPIRRNMRGRLLQRAFRTHSNRWDSWQDSVSSLGYTSS